MPQPTCPTSAPDVGPLIHLAPDDVEAAQGAGVQFARALAGASTVAFMAALGEQEGVLRQAVQRAGFAAPIRLRRGGRLHRGRQDRVEAHRTRHRPGRHGHRMSTLRLPSRTAPPAHPEPEPVPAPAAAAPPKRTPEETAERVRATPERDRQAHLEAVQRRQERGRKVRAEFRRRWPAAFTRPVPLAIGADKLIRAEMPELTAMHFREVLGAWLYSVAYLRAVAAGVERRNLDGTPAGVPDEEQRARAVEELKARGKWPAAEAQGSAEPPPSAE